MRKRVLFVIACFTALFANAQSGADAQWTWMKGDNTKNATGIYGTMGIPSDDNKPGARQGSFSWTDASGNFWLFGGVDGNGAYSDMWKYSSGTNQWTWINGDNIKGKAAVYGIQGVESATNTPGARISGVSWRDHAGNMWLFGGSAIDGFKNDLWRYNPLTNAWAWMKGDTTAGRGGSYGTQATPSATNKPGARRNPYGWTDFAGNLWLFGGRGYLSTGGIIQNLNDLWKYNPSTNQWAWMKGMSNSLDQPAVYGTQGVPHAANAPGGRASSTVWRDATGKLWLFGGEEVYNSTFTVNSWNDLWRFDPATNVWTWMKGEKTVNKSSVYGVQGVPAAANTPGGRLQSAAWSDGYGNLWMFGGQFYGPSMQVEYNDLWRYTIATNEWTWMKGANTPDNPGSYGTQGAATPANNPGARYGAVSFTNATGGIWLFGGSSTATNGGYLNDLWNLNIPVVVPLTLLNVSAKPVDKDVHISWRTAQETNTAYFVVEYSTNGRNFSFLGSVPAAGSSSSTKEYSFVHQNPLPGANQYRIKMVDQNGTFRYSPTVRVTLRKGNGLLVFPNPVTRFATINLTSDASVNLKVQMFDGNGRLVRTKLTAVVAGVNSFIFDMSGLAKGNYTAVLSWGEESQSVRIEKID